MQVTETLSEGLKREYRGGHCRRRTGSQGRCAPGRAEGPRADQRLPSGQGAGRASQARLRPLGHGRSDRQHRARRPTTRSSPIAASSSRPSRRSRCRPKQDEVEKLINGEYRPRPTRSAIEIVPEIKLADFKTIKLTKLVADVSRQPKSTKASTASPSRTVPIAPKAEGAKAANGDRVTIAFVGTHRRRAVRRRHRRRHRGADRLEHLHSGLRRPAHRHRRRREPHRQGDVPDRLCQCRSSPARKLSST